MACGPLRWAAALVARGLRAHPRRFRPLPPARALGCNGAALSWSRSGAGGDLGGDDAEEELEALLGPVLLPLTGVQRMFVVQPRAGGLKRRRAAELQVAEAVALVNTLHNWTVLDKIILPTKNLDQKLIFGKGNFQILTEKIKRLPQATAVFLNLERISTLTKKELEDAWGVKVFDRYTVVLHIFRCNARTKEAKLQIALAEIPLLRSNLKTEVSHLDQQRGGSRYIMGSGETFLETQTRLLRERELKIRNALENLRRKRSILRTQRQKREFPVISVMGYTNCGKTTLIKALTGDAGLQPQDQLFATLDITAHAGYLPSHLAVIYVDTIGFLSDLPHDLIGSFSATLEEVAHSDLIVHVRDVSHPETVQQKASVLSVLKNLNLPSHLLDSIVEVHNKVDLVERWLYKEATVQEVDVMPDDGTASVKVIISESVLGKFRKTFPQ
ncbi:putative GTP-binding protein 6 isoform X3 [Alligator mississippiensis]|uniref:putative GTP-binding protein 6 isoform X3 n=1 Tax=Alligator mississippiensis TaxID=8496 RepID=UPI002877E0C0|nr:putative GTP-binding protein 6 isoform X3 [Alligator mississippiensis]